MLETMETNIENACDNHTSKYISIAKTQTFVMLML